MRPMPDEPKDPPRPPQPPVDWRDTIEREPANWGMLPVITIAVVVIFFILIPWLLWRFTR